MKNLQPDEKIKYFQPQLEPIDGFNRITGVSLPIDTNVFDDFELEHLSQEVLE